MEIGSNTPIIISLGTVVAVGLFIWNTAKMVSKLESNVKSNQHRIDRMEAEYDTSDIKERLVRAEERLVRIELVSEKIESELDASDIKEKLARIEEKLIWITKSLGEKK
jgi:hypothetical protein